MMPPLQQLGFSQSQIETIISATGPREGGSCGFTFSDLTQRLLPAIVLNAYPVRPVDPNTALKIAHEMEATPPFQDGAL